MTPREEIELMIMSYRLLTGIVLTTLIAWTAAALGWALTRRLRRPRRPLVRDRMIPVNGSRHSPVEGWNNLPGPQHRGVRADCPLCNQP